jgi:VWFA-related protein
MARTSLLVGVLSVGLLSSSSSTPSASPQSASPQQPAAESVPAFRVGVDAVRIDVVVTDKNGKLVTNLTTDDFDVHQGGRPQKVVLARWVNIAGPAGTSGTGASAATPGTAGVTAPATAATIERTIVLVVDDLGMSFESMAPARDALNTFVDSDLQPPDLVAVVRTSAAVNVMQQFTTDHRVLHNTIDALAWDWRSRSGVESLPSIFATQAIAVGGVTLGPPGFDDLDALRASMSARNSLAALATLIHGTRSLPGRKAMVFVSEGMSMIDRYDGPGGAVGRGVLPDTRVVMPLDHVIDQAVRSGVVVYSLDPRQLQAGRLLADDSTSGLSSEQLVAATGARRQGLHDTQGSLIYLAQQTGGFAVLDTNDLAAGLSRVTDDQRGYYLIGYTPDDRTFAKPGKTIQYHKISVEVKQRGLRVRTHGGFLGVSDDDKRTAPTPSSDLYFAALSPFTAAGVPMHVTTALGAASDTGVVVDAKVTVNGRALAFDVENGTTIARADVLAVAVDANGKVVSSQSGTVSANQEQIASQGPEATLAYDARLQLPTPGGYQVRFALRDRRSGAIGSAAAFVQVPGAARGALTAPASVQAADRGGR